MVIIHYLQAILREIIYFNSFRGGHIYVGNVWQQNSVYAGLSSLLPAVK